MHCTQYRRSCVNMMWLSPMRRCPAALAFVIIQFFCVEVDGAQRPNIVLIVADDLGYNDVSFHGSNQIPTPNIDSLAYSGVILNNYYVSPICTPTRSALLTGRHPIHTGLQHSVIVGSQPYGLPLNETLLPQLLQGLGYRTHMVGKWHLGFCSTPYTPTHRGFESHFGYYLGCEGYFDHTSEAHPTEWGLDWRRDMDLIWNETNLYSTDRFTAESVRVIENHDTTEPLFMYIPHQAVHSGNPSGDPLEAPQHYVNRFPHIENVPRKFFAGMLAALDDSVGAVTEALRKKNMLNNTIIVFTTDNGGPANGFDANAANNYPLRGLKATLWEGGVRGVGFIHSPLLPKVPYVAKQMIHVCDWLPTLYSAAGGDPRKLHNDGLDLWKMLLANGESVRTEMLHNIDPIEKSGGVRVGEYKLLTGNVGMKWADWYPPWQFPGDSKTLHANVTQRNLKTGNPFTGSEPDDYISELNRMFDDYKKPVDGNPVVIKCGKKPFNASTNCDAPHSPCLFHIPSDPCEYNNLAAQRPDLVQQLMSRLEEYRKTMVPPLNCQEDPAGFPQNNGGAWVPWMK